MNQVEMEFENRTLINTMINYQLTQKALAIREL